MAEMRVMDRRRALAAIFGSSVVVSAPAFAKQAKPSTLKALGVPVSIRIWAALGYLNDHVWEADVPTPWAIGAGQVFAQDFGFEAEALDQVGLYEPVNYAKLILAVLALGLEPTDFFGRNLRTELVEQIADPAPGYELKTGLTLNSHAWASIALRACGVPVHPVAYNDLLGRCRDLMVSRRHDVWGWGSDIDWTQPGTPSSTPDSNDTAAVLIALADLGLSPYSGVIQGGVEALERYQNGDGGFRLGTETAKKSRESVSDVCSDAWTAIALARVGLDSASITPHAGGPNVFDHMAALQIDDGSFDFQIGSQFAGEGFRPTATAFVLVACAGQCWPTECGEEPPPDPELPQLSVVSGALPIAMLFGAIGVVGSWIIRRRDEMMSKSEEAA